MKLCLIQNCVTNLIIEFNNEQQIQNQQNLNIIHWLVFIIPFCYTMKTNQSTQYSLLNTKKPSKTKQNSTLLPSNFYTYLLQDYTFLNEYVLLDSPINTDTQFLAKIKATQQLVKFIKKPFIPTNTPKGLNMYKRFQAMFLMFQKGLVLADNMFILEQGHNTFFYYIIEPYLKCSQSEIDMPFLTLQQYLFENIQNLSGFECRKDLFIKCKNLIDNLFQTGQSYCGLNTRSIVIDDEGNPFLMPYSLEFVISSQPYQRSYYPIEVLKHLQPNITKQPLKCLQKWDVWSFGCICIEIFLYLTPYFMSTSVESEIKRIDEEIHQIFQNFKSEFIDTLKGQIQPYQKSQCSINDHFQLQIDQANKIINFLANVLELDESKRLMSFEASEIISKTQNLNSRRTLRVIKKYQRKREQTYHKDIQKVSKYQLTSKNGTVESSLRELKSLRKPSQNFNQLNIFHKRQDTKINSKQDYQFEMRFKSLTIDKCQKNVSYELQLMVEFSNFQKFKFFIDIPKIENQNESFEIKINKKITFSNQPFDFIEKLLNEDVLITVNFNDSNSQKNQNSLIFINLSALTIQSDTISRLWKKPIKGTYPSQINDAINSKIKIEASLTDLQQAKYQKQNNQKQRIATNKQIEADGQCDKSSKKDCQKQVLAIEQKQVLVIEQVQETSRFRQPLGQIQNIQNSQNNQPVKNEKQIKAKDLSAKIKKLLMR